MDFEIIRNRLATLHPEQIEIRDDSAAHANHAGHSGGSHLHLTIVSPAFTGLSILERHRLIYRLLDDLMQTQIHALAIKAQAPEEL